MVDIKVSYIQLLRQNINQIIDSVSFPCFALFLFPIQNVDHTLYLQ